MWASPGVNCLFTQWVVRGEVPDLHARSGRVTASFSQFRNVSVMHTGTDRSGDSMLLKTLCANMLLSSSEVCQDHISLWPVWPLQMTLSSEQLWWSRILVQVSQEEAFRCPHHSCPLHPWGAARKQYFLSKGKTRDRAVKRIPWD